MIITLQRKVDDMKISKFGHACLLVEEGKARILIDPGAYSKGFEQLENLSAVLITHQHPDHVTPEALASIRDNNPTVAVYGDEGTVQIMTEKGDTAIKTIHSGEKFEVAGVAIAVYGTDHAIIHPSIPGIENVGYMIAGRFFYPGDNFTDPGVPVEILALPIGAPWLKISEVIDYAVAIAPKIAIPAHDAVLAMLSMNVRIISPFTQSQGTQVRVIENGTSIDV
jgi:L-ascorbate metabolism protein UlaG (beta-lactamase superfamily)